MAWTLLLSPLLSACIISLFFLRRPYEAAGISIAACSISFLTAIALAFQLIPPPASYPWIQTSTLSITLTFLLDNLSKIMLLVVTFVGLLVHIFSLGYMKDDPSFARYFAKLSLFMFSMLGIVIADNFITLFIFWELVGLSSYLLIGFWNIRPSAAQAAKKAFLMNRIGDFGFLLGILTFWGITGTISLQKDTLPLLQQSPSTTTLCALLLFCGCIGKSAQFPLHTWLPDAMEGPTPVSALIHAATMVAAGVYMLARIFHILAQSSTALLTIACIGAITALLAAIIATQQDDIKRILAYSTLSQLGLMVLAIGCGSFGAAIYHLTTHAFFKALLFLGAGSVIHAMHHEQNIWKMGALRHYLPWTYLTFLVGAAALAGFPLITSGFYSKETILTTAYNHHPLLFLAATLTSLLTAFYMTRLILIVFFGPIRSEEARKAHESPITMLIPLFALAIPSLLTGFWNPSKWLGDTTDHHLNHTLVMAISILIFILGIILAFWKYNNATEEPLRVPLITNKFFFDELYTATLLKAQSALATLSDWTDRWLINYGLIRGFSFLACVGGEITRFLQNGYLRTYAFWFATGAILLTLLLIK
ncbi:MAG: NADH-quinone oxidoreductase subunit L [Methylacidiphilales bacterium]|nr:NADH-quinone oxidoreductase subunit L [Candidatus Methylacidiphilales bacterium]